MELNATVLQKDESGFYKLEYDRMAMEELKKEIEANYVSFPSVAKRFKFLVSNEYYYPEVLTLYTLDQIEELTKLAYSYGFEFQSYMAMSKFYTSYALRNEDKTKYYEHYEDKNVIVSLFYGRGNFEKAKRYLHRLMKQEVQPATPSYMNAGRARRGELISCFLMRVGDSLNQINHVLNSSGQLSKLGGGVSVDLSDLRALRDPIKGVKGAAKGPMAVAKLLEDTFSAWDQMGQRKGSGAGYIHIMSMDSDRMLHSKKFNADEKIRLKTLSVGLTVPDIFYDMIFNDEEFCRFSPYDVQREYGKPLSEIDFDKMYYEILANPNVRKSEPMKARDFMTDISKTMVESGYPYIMNVSNANAAHPLRNLGWITMSNLCTEIFQYAEVSEIADYDSEEEDEIKRDINCVLSSLNVYNTMNNKSLPESIEDGMDILTDVIEISNILTAPGVRKANQLMHSTGLGLMNLHGYLVTVGIPYESELAREFTGTYTLMMNYYTLKRSMEIAKEKGETFYQFELSDYANGSYFDKYLERDFRPTSQKIIDLFEGMHVPGPEDWAWLKGEIQKYGLWHAYRLAIAPTQSISYIQNATPSLMPITDHVEVRTYGDSHTCYPMPFLAPDKVFLYKSAYHMDQLNIIDLVAAAQEHVDQGISCVLYIDSSMPTDQIGMHYYYAAKRGLKSVYYVRSRDLSKEDCEMCAV